MKERRKKDDELRSRGNHINVQCPECSECHNTCHELMLNCTLISSWLLCEQLIPKRITGASREGERERKCEMQPMRGEEEEEENNRMRRCDVLRGHAVNEWTLQC